MVESNVLPPFDFKFARRWPYLVKPRQRTIVPKRMRSRTQVLVSPTSFRPRKDVKDDEPILETVGSRHFVQNPKTVAGLSLFDGTASHGLSVGGRPCRISGQVGNQVAASRGAVKPSHTSTVPYTRMAGGGVLV